MIKIVSVLLILVLGLGLTACGNKAADTPSPAFDSSQQQSS